MITFVDMKKERIWISLLVVLVLPLFGAGANKLSRGDFNDRCFVFSEDSVTDNVVENDSTLNDKYQAYLNALQVYTSVLQNIQMYYVDNLPVDTLTDYTINCMLGNLDPYTTYYTNDDKEEIDFMRTGEYGGVGATLMARPDSSTMIVSVIKGMPADRAGLKPGDILQSIDGKDCLSLPLPKVSESLRGKPDTDIVVAALRNGKKKVFRFKRESVVVPPVSYYGIVPSTDIGYISINTFNDKTFEQTKNALISLEKTKHLKSLILDLRSNGGGLVSEAVKLANLFLPKGKSIAQLQGRDNIVLQTYETTDSPLFPKLPIVILINENSASSSEILAGALQDYDRAVIVGRKSFGKGVVQSVLQLPNGGVLKFTTSRYHTPSGRCVQKDDLGGRLNSSTKDSLSVFYTANHRLVTGGGGISPDIEVKVDTVLPIVYFLPSNIGVVDYVTEYVRKHTNVPNPFTFKLSNADYDELIKKLEEVDYSYNRMNINALDVIEKNAKTDGTYDQAKGAFEALRKALKPNLRNELMKNRNEVSKLVEQMILRRYLYDEGAQAHSLKTDTDVQAAINILGDRTKYQSILSKPQQTFDK
ncbi:MAG: S41 family peptidase [Porphyromonadaceae bacterium]|nr:S41 family peptidase [Porphyromonadaceae bacterium]